MAHCRPPPPPRDGGDADAPLGHAVLTLTPDPNTLGALRVHFTAPFHNDPPPPTTACGWSGRCEGLWDYEVLELFIGVEAHGQWDYVGELVGREVMRGLWFGL